MAQSFTKNKLSGSTNWKSVKVTGTSTAATVLLHTAVSGTTAWDEIYLFAENTSTSSVDLTIEYGSATAPDDNILVTIPPKSWPILVVPWLLLQNSLTVKAFAATANVITLNGYVHNIV